MTSVFSDKKKLLRHTFIITLSLLLIYLIIRYFNQNPEALQSLSNLTRSHVALIIVIDLLIVGLLAFRTYLVIRSFANHHFFFRKWLRINVIGQSLNFFISQAGDVYRARLAKQHFDLAYANYGSVFLFISWLDILITFATAALLGFLLLEEFETSIISMELLLSFAMIAFLIAPIGTQLLRFFCTTRFCPGRVGEQIAKLLDGFWDCAKNTKQSINLIGIGFLMFCGLTTIVVIIFDGLGSPIELHNAALLLATYRLTHAFIITPGNIGVREWSIGGVCLVLGIDPGLGIIFSLIMRLIRLFALAIFVSLFGLETIGKIAHKTWHRSSAPS
ncbi:MAG: hypothetical protein GKR96_00375 [Gammaproteobacteria bacterium]|nr:hypothetical protein [Gammaproteobacteria bacterium]